MNNLIEIQNVSKVYGHVNALSDINAILEPGHIYGLLGRNGAGKTTLLSILAGAIAPDSGRVEAFGQVPFGRSRSFLADTFYVSTKTDLPPVSAGQFVDAFGPFRPAFSYELYRQYAEELGVKDGVALSRQSTGEQRRFIIAFALASRARMILLDEPFSGLDIIARGELLRIIARQDSPESVIVISSHDTEGLENIFTDLMIVDSGRLILNATVDSLGQVLSFNSEGIVPDTIYVDGLRSISVNNSAFPSDLNLNLLFCAAVSDREFAPKVNNLIKANEQCEI